LAAPPRRKLMPMPIDREKPSAIAARLYLDKRSFWFGEVSSTMGRQAPALSTTSVDVPEMLVRMVPSVMRTRNQRISEGDVAADFELTATDGTTVSRKDLAGKPYVLRLTRGRTSTFI
jgi:hypothetical protein